jgi:hypothetical protein
VRNCVARVMGTVTDVMKIFSKTYLSDQ